MQRRRPNRGSLDRQIKLAQLSLASMPDWMKKVMDHDMRTVFGCSKCGENHTDEYHPEDEASSPSL